MPTASRHANTAILTAVFAQHVSNCSCDTKIPVKDSQHACEHLVSTNMLVSTLT